MTQSLMRILPLILLAASLLLSGCVIVPFPHTVVDAPRASGRVLDASSHHPISNATVGYTGYPATTVLTDSLGHFTTGISRTWRLAGYYTIGCSWPFPPDEGALFVRHPGYRDWLAKNEDWAYYNPFDSDRDIIPFSFGDILLRRLSPGRTLPPYPNSP